MTETKSDYPAALIWTEGESAKIDSKWPSNVLDLLEEEVDKYGETINSSRYIGLAVQFAVANDYLARREAELEERLEAAGVGVESLRHSLSPAVVNEKENLANADQKLYDDARWAKSERVRATFSLPQSVKESVEEAIDESDEYGGLSKVRWICNAILVLRRSPFSCRMERVETKEQLARIAEGGSVDEEEMTPVTRQIRDGELFESVYEDVFLDGTQATVDGDVVDLNTVAPDDDLVLDPDDYPASRHWDDDLGLKKDGSVRAGVFLAFLRGQLESGREDGYHPNALKTQLELRNDYDIDYLWREHVEPELAEGEDDLYYLNAENAPKPEPEVSESVREMQVASDIVVARKPNAQGRELQTAIERAAGEDAVESVSAIAASGLADADALAEVLDLDELEQVRDYLLGGLRNSVLSTMMEDDKLTSVDESDVAELSD